VVMVWLPGQRTAVHDHLTWCVTAVLQGTEYEEVYAHRGDHLAAVARNANPVGTVSGFAPPGDIHQVTNIGSTTAVSMHVYGTDITRVGSSVRRVYDLPVR
jgi:predicted metal-dependent enzyme (double-stranded beta helix superfamily)